MCACVQDFYDFEGYDQQRFDTEHFTKHKMFVQSNMPVFMRNR